MAEEHRAIVYKLSRKKVKMLSQYFKAHAAAAEIVLAVDVDSRELVVMAQGADEEDNLILDGEEDVFEIEDEEIEDDDTQDEESAPPQGE